jgi:hypothetical protein
VREEGNCQRSHTEESRRIFRELDDRFGESNALGNLGLFTASRATCRTIMQRLQPCTSMKAWLRTGISLAE